MLLLTEAVCNVHIRIGGHYAHRRSAEKEPWACSVDLRVPAGTTLALVGESGSGKSSVIQLACRFYDPVQGAVSPGRCLLSLMRSVRGLRHVRVKSFVWLPFA